MRVYYFTSEKWALSDIENRHIKISTLPELNDPFELLGLNVSDKSFRRKFEVIRTRAGKENGVICFSLSWKNSLMWSHYGDKHRGICLGFDVSESDVLKIDYVPERVKPSEYFADDFEGCDQQPVKKLFCLKADAWRYEKEVRMLVPLGSKVLSGHYFTDFAPKLELREVILGPRSRLNVKSVNEKLGARFSGVTILKSRIAFKKFEVVRDKSVEKLVHI